MSNDIEILASNDSGAVSTSAPYASLSLVERAVERGADLATIEKLMELEERQYAKEAERAFHAAMADAFGELPSSVVNDAHGHGYKYTSLAAFVDAVRPAIARHGLSYRWATSYHDEFIVVECIMSHRAGHSTSSPRRAELGSILPEKRQANDMQNQQAIASYLQRYSLRDALGLASGGDTDGVTSAAQSSQVVGYLQRMQSTREMLELKTIFDAIKSDRQLSEDERLLATSALQSRMKAVAGGEPDAA